MHRTRARGMTIAILMSKSRYLVEAVSFLAAAAVAERTAGGDSSRHVSRTAETETPLRTQAIGVSVSMRRTITPEK